ncbi:LOW QUALITY PROTEIN: hypothetical protein HJC23_001630 [Cyclotella cryptica]|uniref:Uncharacterized protein n=1 Tax=Cyclotella cryptica TaxID=29204 RepID=A0ABD3QJW9_9STRA
MNSVEIVAFVQDHDENVNVLNFAPTSPKGGTKSGGTNGSARNNSSEILLRQTSRPSPRGRVNCASMTPPLSSPPVLKSPKMESLTVSTIFSAGTTNQQINIVTPSDKMHPKSPVDDIMRFRASSSESEDSDDEIMQFRANDLDSGNSNATPSQQTTPLDTPRYKSKRSTSPVNIERLRMLPTIIEVATAISDDSSDNVLSHEGTEGPPSCQECISLEEIMSDDNEEEEELNAGQAENATSPPKTSSNNTGLLVDFRSDDNGSDEMADLDQALDDINKACQGQTQAILPHGQRKDQSQVVLSRKKLLDPVSPRKRQDPTPVIVSPRQRQDPPSLLLDLHKDVELRRFSVENAEAEAKRLKHQLDEQLVLTQQYTDQVMAMRRVQTKLQEDLQRELKEVARQNEKLQSEIQKLDLTKNDLQNARSEVENEEAELSSLRDQLKSQHAALAEEIILENQALQDEIEKVVSTKQELAEAKFNAEKEDAELELMKKEYAKRLQILKEDKERLAVAMEQAEKDTNETNEMTRTVLSELEEYKANVEADMSVVRELHDSQMQVLKEEKEKLERATEKASKETTEVKEMTRAALSDFEKATQKEEAEIALLRKEYETRIKLLKEEKEKLAEAIEEAANETTETKEMTRTVLSELQEYKVKLEMDMQAEIKNLKKQIRRMEEEHEETMEALVEKSEKLQAEITAEQEDIENMVNAMEESIESLHQQKENMENELTLRIDAVNQSTKESKRELQQELNKARFSKAKMRFDSMRNHAKDTLKCATVDAISYNVESFSKAAFEAIMEPFSDDLLIKQAKAPEFRQTGKKCVKQNIKQDSTRCIRQTSSHSKLVSPRFQSNVIRQTSSSHLEGKIVSPREILL